MKSPNANKYLEPVVALEVKQRSEKFYIFSILAKRLLEIAYTSERTQYNRQGIQRGLRLDRLREIGKYLSSENEELPLLPNAIIISLSSGSYFKDGLIYIRNVPSGEAFVIDGQHRLWAFHRDFSGDTDFNVVVVAFIDLDDEDKAFVFRSINGNQRKIDPSLVYDLIPMLRNQETIKFEDRRCQDLVSNLNEYPSSPWKDKISMVGGGERLISQASFITALKKLFKKGRIFSNDDPDFFEERIQYDLLEKYFAAIASKYTAEWDNKAFLLCKYVGVSSLLNLLEKIVASLRSESIKLTDDRDLVISLHTFNPYLSKLRKFSFNASEEKQRGRSYVGEGGVTALTQRIFGVVFTS